MEGANDSTVSESQVGISFHYAEFDKMTYRCLAGSDQPDLANYVLNFSLNIRHQVRDSVGEEGGFVVELEFPESTQSFVPSSAWKSSQKFCDSLRNNGKNIPAIFLKIGGFELVDYGYQKTQEFYNRMKQLPDSCRQFKTRVARLGFQPDSNIFILGPHAVFRNTEGSVERIPIEDTEFIWIANRLTPIECPTVTPSENSGNQIFQIMISVLPETSINAFTLTVGKTFEIKTRELPTVR